MSTITLYHLFLYKVVKTNIEELRTNDQSNIKSAIIQLLDIQESECEQIRIYKIEYSDNGKSFVALRAVRDTEFYQHFSSDVGNCELVICNFYVLGQVTNAFTLNNIIENESLLTDWDFCLELFSFFYNNMETLRPFGEYTNLVEKCLNNQYIFGNLEKYIFDNNKNIENNVIPETKSIRMDIYDDVSLAALLDNYHQHSEKIILLLCKKLISAMQLYRTDLAHVMKKGIPRVMEASEQTITIYTDVLDAIVSEREDIPSIGIVKRLGNGAFGTAFKYQPEDKSLFPIVIKKVNTSILNPDQRNWYSRQSFIKEVENTRKLNHTNVIKYHDALFYNGHAFILMEFGGESVHDKYYDVCKMLETDILDCIKSVCRALNYLHNNVAKVGDQTVIHRDVRADNIVYSEPTGTYKLIDFGISNLVTTEDSRFQSFMWGNSLWKSPEYCYHALFTDSLKAGGLVRRTSMTSAKYFSNFVSFKKSWGDVTQAYWRKNPNPFSPHILSEDVIDRKIVEGKLHTTRLLVKKQSIPTIFKRFLTSNLQFCYVKETSIVDPLSQECVITQENINGTRLLHVVETIKFRTVGHWETVLERKTKITGAINAIRDTAFKKYSKNIANTDRGILCVLEGCSKATLFNTIQ